MNYVGLASVAALSCRTRTNLIRSCCPPSRLSLVPSTIAVGTVAVVECSLLLPRCGRDWPLGDSREQNHDVSAGLKLSLLSTPREETLDVVARVRTAPSR